MMFELDADLERRIRECLASGVGEAELMEIALAALEKREFLSQAIEVGWKQAEAAEFVQTSQASVLERAQRSQASSES